MSKKKYKAYGSEWIQIGPKDYADLQPVFKKKLKKGRDLYFQIVGKPGCPQPNGCH